jgi:hypothetical protein
LLERAIEAAETCRSELDTHGTDFDIAEADLLIADLEAVKAAGDDDITPEQADAEYDAAPADPISDDEVESLIDLALKREGKANAREGQKEE